MDGPIAWMTWMGLGDFERENLLRKYFKIT
jgi:hypothetical protein